MAKELTRRQQIERGIITTYRSRLWTPFMKAITEYQLISPGDKIAVCMSGGKDSFVMAKLFQELQRHTKVPFETVYLVMDPGYNRENREQIIMNAELLGIDIQIFDSNIFEVTDQTPDNPCYLCARMRRGALYAKAKELGCSKIALGHHMNDVIETVLISMFYGSKIETMIPKAHSENFEGMELIRPLYKISEADIIDWMKASDLTFIRCACRMTEEAEKEGKEDVSLSKRKEIKQLITQLKQYDPDIEGSMFNAIHSVRIETFPGYKADGKMHSFLENYDKGKDF